MSARRRVCVREPRAGVPDRQAMQETCNFQGFPAVPVGVQHERQPLIIGPQPPRQHEHFLDNKKEDEEEGLEDDKESDDEAEEEAIKL